MNIKSYFSKSFGVMFKGKPYSAGLLMSILFNVLFFSLVLIVLPLIETVTVFDFTIFLTSAGLVLGIGILVLTYFLQVSFAFIYMKIVAEIEGRQEKLFVGFGRSFLEGLFLLIGLMILVVIYGILGYLFLLIPSVGETLVLVLIIFLGLIYMIFIGTTIRDGLTAGLIKSFTLPFKKIKLLGYMVIIGIVLFAMGFVLAYIVSVFKTIQIIIIPFYWSLFLGFVYCFSKE